MTSGKLLIALLCGAAAGATLTLLFAPDKGSETRRKVNDFAENVVDRISDLFGSAVTEEANNGTSRSTTHKGRGQKRTQSYYSES